MVLTEIDESLQTACKRVQDYIHPYAGRVEYGNLRMKISEWDSREEGSVVNIALVYETPGGSTDQINITYSRTRHEFALVDERRGEFTTASVEVVLESIRPRVMGIPDKRHETLCGEIRRHVDGGSNTAGLFGHLNRMIQSEFKGGTITHIELRDAMTYAVTYMKGGRGAGTSAP